MKKTIRLTESDLHRIVMESVKQAINEIGDTPAGQYALGQAAGRRFKRWNGTRRNDNTPADIDSLNTMNDLENHAMHSKKNGRYTSDDYNVGFQQKFYED